MSDRDCEQCVHNDEPWDSEACDGCCEANSHYEPQTDVATYKFIEWENGERTCERDGDDYCSHGIRKELADVPLP